MRYILLRPATMADSGFLLRVRNDYETRSMSRNMDVIGEADHIKWFTTTTDLVYIAETMGERIGYIPFIQHPHETELSFAIAPEHRGKQYAAPMLTAALKLPRSLQKPLVAYVREENRKSWRAFLRADWKHAGVYHRYEAPQQDGGGVESVVGGSPSDSERPGSPVEWPGAY